MASKVSSSNWVKYLTVFNLVVVLILAVVTVHIIKTVKKMVVVQANQASQNNITSVNYKCDNAKTIQAVYFQDKVELNLSSGASLLLMQGVSGSGVRYTNSDESVTFWNKGNSSFIEEGPNSTVTYNNCNQTASQ